ncbi:MAG TPA: hypothetical protein VFG51_00365 [Candidatus Saccharimonadia bacterium]|nr:hypothetical protein [Candidatus Saccharimonadia bacterium]
MAKAKVPASQQVAKTNPNMMMVKTFVAMFVVNGVVLYVANMLFPSSIVLGNMSLSPMWAILLSMGALALVETLVMPFAHEIEKMMGRVMKPYEWMIKYLIVNFLSLWVITRFSGQFGLGVKSWLVVLVLAAVMDFVQGVVMMGMGKMMMDKS